MRVQVNSSTLIPLILSLFLITIKIKVIRKTSILLLITIILPPMRIKSSKKKKEKGKYMQAQWTRIIKGTINKALLSSTLAHSLQWNLIPTTLV